jgi:hypothetical protein
MMKPRLLIGLIAVLGLATPSVAVPQRGASGSFVAAGGHLAAVSAGAPHAASVVRTSSSAVPAAVPVGNSSVRAHATVYGTDAPSRHAGLSSSTGRGQNAGNRVFKPIGTPLGPRHNPPPVTTPGGTPRVIYLLGVGGYYYAAPGEAAVDQPQEAVEPDDQQGDDQQIATDDQQARADEDRGRERVENRDGARGEVSVGVSATEQRAAAEQEPLPDVGTLTLVLRDGSRLDVVAFTMTQGNVIYITPEGRRLSISAEILDADATQRVNQERGTPMQLPL